MHNVGRHKVNIMEFGCMSNSGNADRKCAIKLPSGFKTRTNYERNISKKIMYRFDQFV